MTGQARLGVRKKAFTGYALEGKKRHRQNADVILSTQSGKAIRSRRRSRARITASVTGRVAVVRQSKVLVASGCDDQTVFVVTEARRSGHYRTRRLPARFQGSVKASIPTATHHATWSAALEKAIQQTSIDTLAQSAETASHVQVLPFSTRHLAHESVRDAVAASVRTAQEILAKQLSDSLQAIRDSIRIMVPRIGLPRAQAFFNASLVGHEVRSTLSGLVIDDELDPDRLLALLDRLPNGPDLDELVFQVEDARFEGAAQQEKLVTRLLEIASTRRFCTDAMADAVTRCAIRRAASLLPIAQADRLLPFFEDSPVDTLLPALVSLLRLIETDVPAVPLESVGQRLSEIAAKHADPVVYGRGSVDAILMTCLTILAFVSPADFEYAAPLLLPLGRPFLIDQLAEEVRDAAEYWPDEIRTIGHERLASALSVTNGLRESDANREMDKQDGEQNSAN